MTQQIAATPIVKLYNDLHAKGTSRKQKLERARAFVADPTALAAMFGESVAAMQAYAPNDEGFYTRRSHYDVGEKVTGTIDFALRVRDAGGIDSRAGSHAPLEGEPIDAPGVESLSAERVRWEYLDRELVATRSTSGATQAKGSAIRLDLLLKQFEDGTPVIAELKRTTDIDDDNPDKKLATDKDAFSALVQALACVSQLATPAQYARLSRFGRARSCEAGHEVGMDAGLAFATPPTFDVAVVLHNRPTSTHLPELTIEAERLSALLLAQPVVARYVRRIVCIVTETEGDRVASSVEFAYQRQPPGTSAIETAFGEYFRPWGLHLPGPAALGEARAAARTRMERSLALARHRSARVPCHPPDDERTLACHRPRRHHDHQARPRGDDGLRAGRESREGGVGLWRGLARPRRGPQARRHGVGCH